jgi:hypothetical protein
MNETETLEVVQLTPIAQETEPVAPPAVPTFEQAVQAQNGSAGMADVLKLELFKDYAEIDMGNNVKKQISHETLRDILNKTLNTAQPQSETIKGMLMPSNVFFMSQTANRLHFNTYYLGGKRSLLYGDRKMEIMTPNIIISFTLRKDGSDWIIDSEATKYFCTDLPLNKLPKDFINQISHKDGIYLLPMSNTYDEGKMCYGNNSMPARFKDNNFRGLDWYFRYLWETPFNNDLGIRAVGSVSVSTWYDLLARMARENKTFPYRDLRGWKEIDGAIPSTSELGRDRDR